MEQLKSDLKHLGVKEDDNGKLTARELIEGLVAMTVILFFAVSFGVLIGG